MNKIPKIIHYCGVGNEPKPQSVLYCIESWKKYCPDYEIKEWNETNYDFTKNLYMKQAYETKKWGFVPDYARLDIIYQYGGIYLDTDVEIIKSFDHLLKNECFFGFENTGDGQYFVNCGHGFGASPNNEIIKKARDIYNQLSFINDNGTLNMTPSPFYTTQVLRQFGLIQNNEDQTFNCFRVFSSDVLCPKSFRTGKLNLTSRSVSIHHFTASWMDKKIKLEMEHQKKIYKFFGKGIGKQILYIESVFQKYTFKDLLIKFPNLFIKKVISKAILLVETIPYYQGLFLAKFKNKSSTNIALLDTSIESDNCGDDIIMENCVKQLDSCLTNVEEIPHIPTHRFLTEKEKRILTNSNIKILCGTNILSGHMRSYGLWKLTADVTPYRNTILLGIGFDSKAEGYDLYSKCLFKTILYKKGLHSVRDSFSERKLKTMGIHNVVNTGCPTMWNLTPDHCKKVPKEKANQVICTITDYLKDPTNDKAMFDILLESYNNVYLWLQGENDFKYIQELGYDNKLVIIGSTLEDFDSILKNDDLDYVGTRLHAGIRAISKFHRSLIVSIDNRAESISADTGLPTIRREDIKIALKERLFQNYETKIKMPWENIKKWKEQFEFYEID